MRRHVCTRACLCICVCERGMLLCSSMYALYVYVYVYFHGRLRNTKHSLFAGHSHAVSCAFMFGGWDNFSDCW